MRRILINTGWASAAMPFNLVLGIVQTGLMARMLGPEGLGIIALYTATCALVGGFCKLNNSQAALTYVTQAITEGDSARAVHVIRYCYGLDLLTSLFAFTVLAGLTFVAPLVLDLKAEQVALQVVFALTLVFQSTYLTSNALLRVAHRFSWTFYQSLAQSLLKLVVVACLFYVNAGLREVVWMLVGISLFNGLSLFVMAKIAFRDISIAALTTRTLVYHHWWQVPSEIRKFQTYGYGSSVMKSLYRYLDVLLIGLVGNANSVGLYRAAAHFAGLLDLPVQAMIAGMSPEYSRLWYASEKKQLLKVVVQSTALLVGAMGILLIVFIPLSGPIITLVYGDAFSAGQDVFVILVIASLLSALMVPLNTLQMASGQAWPSTLASVVTVGGQGTLLFWLVPLYGTIGAAWARVFALVGSLAIMIPTGILRLKACPDKRILIHSSDKDS